MTSGGVVVLLYLNIFLLFGLILRHFLKRVADVVPYTVLLLAIGLALGFVARALEDEDANNAASSAAAISASSSSNASGSAAGRRLTAASGSAAGSGTGEEPWWTPRADFMYAIATLGGLDPHLMLYIFLPALLFESANAIDFHCFRKVVGKTVTLAFPCMLLGSGMMASVVRLAYPEWSWDLCLLLGTITSATDPVAVVAMLRELGAKVSLSTTIEGESLLNDGSAVVLFRVLKDIAQAGGTVGDVGGIIGDFFRMAVLGPVIGAAFGALALIWCSRVFNDPLVEISISIVAAYLAYYVSEYWIHSSGVLTVVFTGLAFASTFGRTSISPEVFHFLHEFWETLGYVANTIIFLITGVAIAYNFYELDITSRDVGISFLVYCSGLVIRTVIFVITYPLFTRMPYSWTWQEALIASWGGLRGAVGLALGLDIFLTTTPTLTCPGGSEDPNIACQNVKGRILLHTSMMVVCTLVINASTLKPLLSILKFVELSKAELKMLEHISYRLEADAKKYEVTLQDDPFLSNSNWEVVRQYTYMLEMFKPLLKGTRLNTKKEEDDKAAKGSLDAGTIAWHAPSNTRNSRIDVHELLQRESLEGGRASRHSEGADGPSRATDGIDEAEKLNLLNELKYQYHMSLKASVWHQQHEGTLGSSATDILVDALNHKLDDKHAVDWIKWEELQAAGGQMTGFRLPPWISRMRKIPVLGPLFDALLGQRLQTWHDIAYGFLSVHEHLEHEVEHWTDDAKLKEELRRVMHVNAEGARRSLIDLQEVLPEVCLAVNTRQAARLMLNATREKVKEMEDHGQLPGPQAKAMRLQVETQMRKLQLARMPLDLSKEKVLSEVKWIHDLKKDADEVFQMLVYASSEIQYKVGEYVVKQGELPIADDSHCVYLIARGIVDIIEDFERPDGTKEEKVVARRGSGMVIGEQALLTGAPRANSARACTSVLALGLSHAMLHEAMDRFPELGCRLWHRVGLNMAQKLLGEAEEAKRGERTLSLEELQEAASQWVPNMEAVRVMTEGTTMLLERKVLLLHGSCIEYREDEQKPTEGQREALKQSLQREALEAQLAEQEALQHKRQKTAVVKQRRFSAARIFGAGATPEPQRQTSFRQINPPTASPGRQDDVIAQTAKNAAMMMGLVPVGASAPGAAPEPSLRSCSRPAGRTSIEGSGANGLASVPEHSRPRPDLHNQRRLIHQDSQWIVHIAPCIIDVPTGGAQAKHELTFLVDDCRLCVQPDSARDSHGADAADARTRAAGGELDGEPLQFMTSPHPLERDLRKDMLKKLARSIYQPGETLVDGKTNNNVVHFVVSGTVRCDVDDSAPPATGVKAPAADALGGQVGVYAAGEPFVRGSSFLFAPPAGAPLGEWLLLQDKERLVQRPRVVAETAVTCVTLPIDVLDEARVEDKHIETNLWWARCQREAFCYCRKLRPFAKWQPSKLWRWLQLGKHVKVPAGHGLLKETMPFVVLLHGSCHVSYTEAGPEPHGGADAGGAPHRESTGARHDRQTAIGGQRRQLGSMVLLGSGAKIADLLTFHTHHSKSKDMVGDELVGSGGGGKTVSAPEVIYCHEQIAYHFRQDSLVFIPSEASLSWLPANSSVVTNGAGSAELAAPVVGTQGNLDKGRVGSPIGTIAEGDTLAA